MPTIGECTQPGCLAGSSAAVLGARLRPAAAAPAAPALRGGMAIAASSAARATRTRMPSRSISISLRPVSSSSSASSRISSWSTLALPFMSFAISCVGSFLIGSARMLLLSSAVWRRCRCARPWPADPPWPRWRARSPSGRSRRLARAPPAPHRSVCRKGSRLKTFDRCTSITGRPAAFKRVEDGDRGVGVGAGVEDDAVGLLARLLDPVDQLALRVGLAEVDGRGPAPAPAPRCGGGCPPASRRRRSPARERRSGSGSAR